MVADCVPKSSPKRKRRCLVLAFTLCFMQMPVHRREMKKAIPVISKKNILKRILPLKFRYWIAGLQRKRTNHVTFVGITGSVGKTTTTDLTATILADFGPCQKTHEYNTLKAIVGTVWHTRKRHRYCVAELGASGPDTLNMPARLVKPDIAVITRIGRDHYAAYKSMELLAAEKAKVVQALPPHGIAVLNSDDPLVRSIGEHCNRPVIWFGKGEGATLRLIEAHSRWPEPLTMRVAYKDTACEIRTQLHGIHSAIPVLASLGVALAADLPLAKAISTVARFQPTAGRMQVVTANDGVAFIRDDLKAPYWSINAPIEFLRDARASRKIAVIGTFSDSSGDYGPKYRDVAGLLHGFADLVVFIGPHARRGTRESQDKNKAVIRGFRNIQNAAEFLDHELRPGDLVLVKGTNEQDHLVRLILNRDNPIQCWEGQCGLQLFCDGCPKLNEPRPNTHITKIGDLQSGSRVPLIVGLGNPGARFKNTPHNVGYRVLDQLARSEGGRWVTQAEGTACSLDLNGIVVQLFKPGTAMNSSGAMVCRFVARSHGSPQNCIIVHDDVNFSLGNVRMKSKGGDAGHKGMRSILSAFDTEDIPRIRLGVGLCADARQARQRVLTKFSADEEKRLMPALEQAAALVKKYIRNQFGG